jgi:hypothetical protein
LNVAKTVQRKVSLPMWQKHSVELLIADKTGNFCLPLADAARKPLLFYASEICSVVVVWVTRLLVV